MSDEPTKPSEQSEANYGKWMILVVWLLILGGGTFFGQKWLDKRRLGQSPASIITENGKAGVLLQANSLGHYIVEGLVNGQTVTFLVDTGASGVSIPGEIAQGLGLIPGREQRVVTANGSITVRETAIDSLAIGQLRRNNVRASINSSMDGEVGLLGMTFLRHFELVQRDDFLAIREP